MAARFRVVILEQLDARNFRYLFWADVPVARQAFYVQPVGTISSWKDAITADNTSLVNGSVVEKTGSLSVATGTTLAQAQGMLEAAWTQFQNRVTNDNPWVRYGTTWNGTTWVNGGVS